MMIFFFKMLSNWPQNSHQMAYQFLGYLYENDSLLNGYVYVYVLIGYFCTHYLSDVRPSQQAVFALG